MSLFSMHAPEVKENNHFTILGSTIKPEAKFTFLNAINMEYREYDEAHYNSCLKNGIAARIHKDLTAAIDYFLQASSYRKIQALTFLAQS